MTPTSVVLQPRTNSKQITPVNASVFQAFRPVEGGYTVPRLGAPSRSAPAIPDRVCWKEANPGVSLAALRPHPFCFAQVPSGAKSNPDGGWIIVGFSTT